MLTNFFFFLLIFSGAIQVVGGMAIDLPSIHSIAVVSNTTAKSEFEVKMRLDIRQDAVSLEIEKPDEELDFIHIQWVFRSIFHWLIGWLGG